LRAHASIRQLHHSILPGRCCAPRVIEQQTRRTGYYRVQEEEEEEEEKVSPMKRWIIDSSFLTINKTSIHNGL
jgi:hypothetical protein